MSRQFKSEVKCTVKSVKAVSSQCSYVKSEVAWMLVISLDLYSGGPRLISSSLLFDLCSEAVNTTPQVFLQIEGCPIHPICNGSPNWWRFVTDRNYSSPFVSSRHVSDRASSSALIRMFAERGTLLHFSRLFICLVCESSWPIIHYHPFWRPITDRVYWTCICK